MFVLNASGLDDENFSTTIDSVGGDGVDESFRYKFFERATLSRWTEKFLCAGIKLLVVSCGGVELSNWCVTNDWSTKRL